MIGGMGQRRPPTGPSPYTAGRPNPMAGFQGGGFKGGPPMQGPGMGGGAQPMAPWMPPPPPQMPPGGQASPPSVQQLFGGYQGSPPWMGTGQPLYAQGSPGGTFTPPPNAQVMPEGGMGGGYQDMSDAMMHPFAPRNRGPQGIGPNFALPQRPQFPGAAQGGIMGGMGGGPQMGRRPPPQMPPWMQGPRYL